MNVTLREAFDNFGHKRWKNRGSMAGAIRINHVRIRGARPKPSGSPGAPELEYRESDLRELFARPKGQWATNDFDRIAEVFALRDSGSTLQSIADIYGLSRQRIHQILRG